MKILWLTWKDKDNPLAGGAEVVNEEIARRLTADGHEVHFVVAGFPGSETTTKRGGYTITRVGGRYSAYWKAASLYRHELSDWPDLVIDEVNTIPFFASFYAKQPVVLFIHQLCREIWFYQLPFPLSLIGYLLEPLYLWLLRKSPVITVSESTKQDLVRYGFTKGNIEIISEGIELTPIKDVRSVKKFKRPTVLSLGNIRPMKRTLDQLRAFEITKQSIPNLQLKIAGSADGRYGERVLRRIHKSPFKDDIKYLGRVSNQKKLELVQRAHVITVTSIKEGWGLIVTEAASQGTPAVVYDVDGLRDSVRHRKTGLITSENTPRHLALEVEHIINDHTLYSKLQNEALRWSRNITFERSYDQFLALLRSHTDEKEVYVSEEF